jgi:hypothetical protein
VANNIPRVVITGIASGCEREFLLGDWICRNCGLTEHGLRYLKRTTCLPWPAYQERGRRRLRHQAKRERDA